MEEEKKMYALRLGGDFDGLILYIATDETFNEEVNVDKKTKKEEKIKTLKVNINKLGNNPSDFKAIYNLFGIKTKMFSKLNPKGENKELKFQILEGLSSFSPIGQSGIYPDFSAKALKEKNE